MIRLGLFLLASCVLFGQPFSFEASEPGEAVAELDLRSPGADWAVVGREAGVITVQLDGKFSQHIILYGGPAKTTYRVFLGAVTAGKHQLALERDAKFSAAGTGLEVDAARFHVYGANSPEFAVISHAPVLYARKNTVGRFSDVPLIVYCERTPKGLQYTVIFSNEDGGTSTRALMARWGRTTDIEYVYDWTPERSIVQGPGHKDLEFKGKHDGAHPLLMPVTDNNMIAEAADSPLRFQIAPLAVDLARASRESVMDQYPVTFTVMTKELQREGKLRPYGTVDGEKISDQRNYLNVDYTASHESSAFSVQVELKSGHVFASDLGRLDYAIGRNGSVRTTVELPPGTKDRDIQSIHFACITGLKGKELAHHGTCRLESVNRVFFLDKDGLPGPDLMKSVNVNKPVPTGQALTLRP